MKPYRYFELTIEERGGRILHPSYAGCVDEEFLEDFFGLHEGDVVNYEIREVKY